VPGSRLSYDQGAFRVHREIPELKIEYFCNRRERGVYRLAGKKPITTNFGHEWQYRRAHCGDLFDFASPYPSIE